MTRDRESGELDWLINRKAVAIGPQCAIMLNIYRTRRSLFDTFGMEYEDVVETQREAARELMSHIEPECSVNFLWSLREAIAEMIERHNDEYDSNHPIDRPPHDPRQRERRDDND